MWAALLGLMFVCSTTTLPLSCETMPSLPPRHQFVEGVPQTTARSRKKLI